MKPCDLSSQFILFHYAIILARYMHPEKEIKSLLYYYYYYYMEKFIR